MELMTKLIVTPLLWIVYITLPLLIEPLTSPPLLRRYAPSLRSVILCLIFAVIYECYLFVRLFSYVSVGSLIGLANYLAYIGPFWAYVPFLSVYLGLHLELQPSRILLQLPLSAGAYPSCLGYIVDLGMFAWAKATTHLFIFGLKNRRECQLLSALTATVLGFTEASIFAAIPVSLGMLLTIPDLDADPCMEFKVRFAEFLTAHMDEEALQALLYSKFFKMLGCNEMKPSLPGHVQSSARAWFRRDGSSSDNEIFYDSNVELERCIDEGISSQEEIFYDSNVELEFFEEEISSQHEVFFDSIVEPEYRIGLGSFTTSVRQDQIDVTVFTPFSGLKNRSIKNTPRSRYNLDKSARFWRENPETGIWNMEMLLAMDFAEVEIYCVSVDDWIKFCGSDDYIFEELVLELVSDELNQVLHGKYTPNQECTAKQTRFQITVDQLMSQNVRF